MPSGSPAGQSGGTWWVIPEGTAGLAVGQIARLFETGTLGTGSEGASGLTSLFTVTQSATKPNGAVAGPFVTQAEAQTSANSANSRIASHTTPTPGNTFSGLAAIGDFFSRLTQANLWIRVGEVALGLILLAVGLARITHAVPIATAVAKKVGAVGLVAA